MLCLVRSKWKTLSFVHLLSYLERTQKANNMTGFVVTAHLVRSLAQFDAMFEVKLATHLLLHASQQPGESHVCQQVLAGYATLFYTVNGPQPTGSVAMPPQVPQASSGSH